VSQLFVLYVSVTVGWNVGSSEVTGMVTVVTRVPSPSTT
jgi:hypothetical protein